MESTVIGPFAKRIYGQAKSAICGRGNRAIALFSEDVKTFESAIDYLRKAPPMIEKVPKVAIYARVSTTDQDCRMQLDELREFCQRRGWILCAEYIDEGWSGAKKDRPQFT